MVLSGFLAQTAVCLVFAIPVVQALAPNPPATSESRRIHIDQKHLCCVNMHFVEPIYPREARLDHIEGQVRLSLLVAENGTISDLQVISGDPLLVDATLKAVRQWRFGEILGGVRSLDVPPVEYEIPITFSFTIKEPPKPAYLYLTDSTIIRADEVREYTNGIEYKVGQRIHHISPDAVKFIGYCSLADHDCVPSGGPNFDIWAIPLRLARKQIPSVPR
jgi:TonB family protein